MSGLLAEKIIKTKLSERNVKYSFDYIANVINEFSKIVSSLDPEKTSRIATKYNEQVLAKVQKFIDIMNERIEIDKYNSYGEKIKEMERAVSLINSLQ